MLGGKEVHSIKNIPLSNGTVSRRIINIASKTKEHFVHTIQENPWFRTQIDETTDVAGLAQLFVFVREIHEDGVFEDETFRIIFSREYMISVVFMRTCYCTLKFKGFHVEIC